MSKQHPIATRYKALAQRLMPQQDDLIDVAEEMEDEYGTENVTAQHIDDATFRRSEYLGGMAAALLAMLAAETSE